MLPKATGYLVAWLNSSLYQLVWVLVGTEISSRKPGGSQELIQNSLKGSFLQAHPGVDEDTLHQTPDPTEEWAFNTRGRP